MSPQTLDDHNLDVLQNLETAIVGVYRQHTELSDEEVLNALGALLRVYQAEERRRPAPALRLNPLTQEVFAALKSISDWRLGREMLYQSDGQPLALPAPLLVTDLVACLKRLRRSAEMWHKDYGRQGYLKYIGQFL